MAEEGFKDPNKNSDADRDFGLPKVEIKPIEPTEEQAQKENPMIVAGTVQPEEPVAPSTTPASVEKELVSEPKPEKKKSSLSWIFLLLVLVVVGLGAWFFYTNRQAAPIPVQGPQTEVKIEKPTLTVPPPKKEVAEPVEPKKTISLIPIQSRADKPRYFVVAGSFIDGDMARDFSQILNQKGLNTYLVYPYADVAFYRLAIGHYETFGLAVEEINRVKDGFKENLWVLKY